MSDSESNPGADTPPENVVPASAPARIVRCFACGASNPLHDGVVRLQCRACSKAIDLDDYKVEGVMSRGIATHGNVLIERDSRYHGPKLVCSRLEVRGKLDAAFSCEELILSRNATLGATGFANDALVETGARATARLGLTARHMVLKGVLDVPEVRVEGRLVIKKGGSLNARIQARGLVVEPGARFEGDVEILSGHDAGHGFL
jgi:hypothetical protein